MSTKKHIYVNPLGGVKEIDYNNVEKLKSSTRTINARVEDSKLQNQSHYLECISEKELQSDLHNPNLEQ